MGCCRFKEARWKIECDPQQTNILDYLNLNSSKTRIEEIEKMKVEETKEFEPLKNGVHQGGIVDVEEVSRAKKATGEVFKYVDVSISVSDYQKDDGNDLILKIGFPAKITDNTDLGKFIKDMGYTTKVGKNFDLDSLRGSLVEYMTKQVEVPQNDGSVRTYSNIVKGSIVKV